MRQDILRPFRKNLRDRLLTAKPLLEPALFDTLDNFRWALVKLLLARVGLEAFCLIPVASVWSFSQRRSETVFDSLLEAFENPIYELEWLPVLGSYRALGQQHESSAVGCRLRQRCCSSYGSIILEHTLGLEDKLGLKAWYARVPTHSNVADGPSKRRERLKSRGVGSRFRCRGRKSPRFNSWQP